jgi:hypothetical protein
MEGRDFQGKIEHVGSGQFQIFHSYGEMVRVMHDKMEDDNVPQSGSILRSWS